MLLQDAVNRLKDPSANSNGAIVGLLNTKINEYITAQVDKTKGAVNGGSTFFRKCITIVDKAAPIKSAAKAIISGLKKLNIALRVRVPLKPYNPFWISSFEYLRNWANAVLITVPNSAAKPKSHEL